MQKVAVSYVYVIFWEQSQQAGVENGAMLTTAPLKLRPYGAIQICLLLLLLFFWPSVDMFPREFKN